MWTLREDIGSFTKPMELFFKSLDQNIGIPSELPLKYLPSIIFASLIGIILGAAQMLVGFKSGGYFTLVCFAFLSLVKDYPGWHRSDEKVELSTIFFLKDLAVIGGILLFLSTPSSK